MMDVHIIPTFYLYLNGIHIHHLSYGILSLALTGFIALGFPNFTKKHRHGLAILYGINLKSWGENELGIKGLDAK